MKTIYKMAFMAAVVALLVSIGPVRSFADKIDDSIESSAKKTYVYEKYLKDDAIKIESKDGVVTLTGTVAEGSHKSMAQETVASLPGVKSVDNQLKIKDAPAEKSDAWLTTKVKTALLFHRNVSVMTEVTTKDGIVSLKGEADNSAQKELTTEYAKDVEGVKEVKNEMSIAMKGGKPDKQTLGYKMNEMGESIDDASITALVKMTLLYHRSTSAIQTKVETENGLVTLEGQAGNAAEKALVTKYVEDVHGVKSVINNMTIKNPKMAAKS
ncbi:MAG: BON domain-containing protein [Proteobacteria bacterium]|nr:BON domain-containing protein [Pseudomonadota bacterium]